jgi:outer membrane immunogenic protein
MAPPPPRAPAVYAPAPIPYYNWTGFYIGGNLGWGWSQGSFSDPAAGVVISGTNTSSFLGGAQVGGNYEFSNGVLIGVESDFDWLLNSNNTSNPGAGGVSVTANDRWFITLTGRLGYAFDRFLVYGKGGGAWVGSSNPVITAGGATFSPSTSNSNYGWTVGAGAEWAFWGNLSARLEYDYIGLNSQTFAVPAGAPAPIAGTSFSGQSRSFQMVNLGLNYKFGGW